MLQGSVKITYGMATYGTDYGMMLYHKNRLIKAYEKVGYQKQVTKFISIISIGVCWATSKFITRNHGHEKGHTCNHTYVMMQE